MYRLLYLVSSTNVIHRSPGPRSISRRIALQRQGIHFRNVTDKTDLILYCIAQLHFILKLCRPAWLSRVSTSINEYTQEDWTGTSHQVRMIQNLTKLQNKTMGIIHSQVRRYFGWISLLEILKIH